MLTVSRRPQAPLRAALRPIRVIAASFVDCADTTLAIRSAKASGSGDAVRGRLLEQRGQLRRPQRSEGAARLPQLDPVERDAEFGEQLGGDPVAEVFGRGEAPDHFVQV